MSCTYTIYDGKNGSLEGFSYEELVDKYNENKYQNITDVLYSRDDKQEITKSKIYEIKYDYKIRATKDKDNGSPDYGNENTFTTQTFIDSGKFRFNGNRIIPEQTDETYVQHQKEAYMSDEGLDEQAALIKAQNDLKDWQIVAEDAKVIHGALNSFDFVKKDRDDFPLKLRGTKFESVAYDLYDQFDGNNKPILRLLYGRHKFTQDSKAKIIQNVNLTAKITGSDEDIIGHIDNLVIDTDGNLHIYNYKYTQESPSNWSKVKKEKYRYQLALLKQMLAYNGFDVSKTEVHIIPIKVKYNDDKSKVTGISVYDPIDIMPYGKEADIYETTARKFIKSNVTIDDFNSDIIDRVNSYLNVFFPQRDIKFQGIQKTTKEWIKQNYNSRVQSRIKQSSSPDYAYEVYFDDEFKKPVFIKDSNPPLENNELIEAVEKHIKEINTANSKNLDKLVNEIRLSRRRGYYKERSISGNRSIAEEFLIRRLSKYLLSYTEHENGRKEYEWDLIENDTLQKANILLFKNVATDQIDVVVLSDFDLYASTSYKGRKNIMGYYLPDASVDTQTLINYPATYGNIEALKTMIILNEVLPMLGGQKVKLGDIKIISTHHKGQIQTERMETLNRDMFQQSVRALKKNITSFNYQNNFSKATYTDPIDLLIYDFETTIKDERFTAAEKDEFSSLNISHLTNPTSREQRRKGIQDVIQQIYKIDPTFQKMDLQSIRDIARNGSTLKKKTLANLWIEAQIAYDYYSGINIRYQDRIGKVYEYAMTQNRVPNVAYGQVVSTFTKAIDDIAYEVRERYKPIYDFTMNFYEAQGFGSKRGTVIGDQVRAFDNLYRRNERNEILMEFRNPYKQDTQKPLTAAERTYLKKVIYQLTKLRAKNHGFTFNFNSSDIDTPRYKQFIEENKGWIFNVPLEKASSGTITAKGFKSITDEWVRKAKLIIKDPKGACTQMIQGIGTAQEQQLLNDGFDTLHLENTLAYTDGYKGSESLRNEIIVSHQPSYFETNVENLLAKYLEKTVQVEKFNEALITVKGVMLELTLLGDELAKENQKGIEQSKKMINDFVKVNIFNQSIMEPESQKVMAWVTPFRRLVSEAYIAGNIISMFRDTFEGMWQNTAKVLTKYQTDITAKDLTKAYKDVIIASFSSIRDITIIDELCKMYRLSNLDVARISDGLTTSRGGFCNIDTWMYKTLRAPDFLNRMVLFCAKCRKDGVWDAFDLDNNKLIYDWKKDKRFSIYASGNTNDPKYNEQRIAYHNAIREYNAENSNNVIKYDDNLPRPYTNREIQQMRQVSNSIYGAYDKSMKAKLEHCALGMSFAMFSTWMNGIVSNYFTKLGIYEGGPTRRQQAIDGSGNLLYFDNNGVIVVEYNTENGKEYVYEETGEKVENIEELNPFMEDVPMVVQGIAYTLIDTFKAVADLGFKDGLKKVYEDPVQAANLRKMINDLIAMMLFALIFKCALAPAYKEFKKGAKERTAIENAVAEVMYKSTSRSFDNFFGPLAVVEFLGENTNPPVYSLGTKLPSDLVKAFMGEKTAMDVLTGNVAIFRSFSDTYKAEKKKAKDEV